MSIEPYDPKPDFDFLASIDESIFYPERRIAALGLDENDIEDLMDFLRWHIARRDERAKTKQSALLKKEKLLEEVKELDKLIAKIE
jgi:hypothetical protein